MNRNRKRHVGPPPCDAVGPDDGIDPSLLFRPEAPPRDLARLRRLCAEVGRALDLALCDCGDPLLQELSVDEVLPAPDATRLEVRVRLLRPVDAQEVALLRERLARARGRLREAAAAAVQRRRAPDLTFRVIPGSEVGP